LIRIYSDMDGYIANFIERFLNKFGITDYTHDDINYYDHIFDILKYQYGINKTKAWKELNDKNFWKTIDPYPWLDLVSKHMTLVDPNWTVITSLPLNKSEGINGKSLWIKEYLPEIYKQKRVAFVASKKYLFAHSCAILIDDNETIIDEFEQWKGKGILVPMPWNRLSDLYFKINTREKMSEYINKKLCEKVNQIKKGY